MKTIFVIAAALLAAPLAAQSQDVLPGVASEETKIPAGGIAGFQRGQGDVLFMLARTGQWYRVGLNQGCLKGMPHIYSMTIGSGAVMEGVDRFTQVQLAGSGSETLPITCRIDSVRRSAAPPQVDSRSQVALD